jgi:predicted metalloendopeptidase
VFDLETSLAASHMTRTACRDPELTYNMKSLEEIKLLCAEAAAARHKEIQIASGTGVSWATYLTKAPPVLEPAPSHDAFNNIFNWEEYFRLTGKDKDQLGEVNVATIGAIERAYELMCLSDKSDLQHYLIFHSVLSFSDCHLPQVFKEAHFEFYEKILKGTTEMKPRWKTVLASMEVT